MTSTEIITGLVAVIGAISGGSGVLYFNSVRKAKKAENENAELRNDSERLEQMNKTIEAIDKGRELSEKINAENMTKIERRVERLEKIIIGQKKVIKKGYECPFVTTPSDCIILMEQAEVDKE